MKLLSNKKFIEGDLTFWRLKRYKNLKAYGITICYWVEEPRDLTAFRLKEARHYLNEYASKHD